ncbi:MAG: DNA repair protein RecO [Tissierellia bacterium]|nr:DNA repair protein RecO [Tissierellia bacterium]
MGIKTEGIVIKEFRFKETSKILTIYTKKYGKVNAMARGAYRPKSQLIATTQPFSYNEYHFFKGKNFYYINQADIMDPFYPIRENINRMMYGSYMLELVDLSTLEEEENDKLFQLLLKGLKVLCTLDRDFVKFILSFELKFISFLGYKPHLESCVVCNRKKFSKFSINRGGIICSDCSTMEYDCKNMDIAMYKAMKYLLYTPLDNIFAIKIPKDTTFKLHDIMVKYILSRIERKQFNSLNMIKAMKGIGGV